MYPAGVRITPKPLNRRVIGQRGGPGGLEQPVYRGDRTASGAHLVPTCAGAQLERNLLARLQQCILVADVADQLAPRGVDVAGRLGDTDLGERVILSLFPGERRPHPLALVLHVRLVGAVGHAHDRRRDGGGMHGAPRHLVHRGCVGLISARGAVVHVLVGQEPVPRHEDVLDDDGVAAGAAQADHVPHVVDAVFATRDQEAAEVDRSAVFDDGTAEKSPGGVVAAGRPVPRAADQVAAVDHDAGAHRGVRRRDPGFRVVAPDLFLGLLVEQRQVPVVHPDDRGHPAGGAACARQPPRRLVEKSGIALQAAPLLRLQQGEEADVVERRNGLVG